MFKSVLLAIRPKTLTAAIVPIMVAASLVQMQEQKLQLWIVACALLSAIFIQIATNFFNDAIDFKKGADTDQRIGPQRVTQSGLMSSQSVFWWAIGFCVLALFFGVPLVYKGGWVIVGIGLLSLFLAYGYTGGPFPLAYKGLGDFFVILFFGLIAVGGVYYLLVESWSVDALVAGLQCGFLATVLIAINNLRDVEQDKLVHKKTLPVRFGVSFAKLEIILLISLSYLLNLYWWFTYKLIWVSLLPLLTLPLAVVLIYKLLMTKPSKIYNQFLALSALLQIIFCGLLSIGFLLQ
ncbi:MAG: 1,4-dihydroxy-2-naphthoate octaprenyltransferase [Bdellovibrionales bacterium]|nr:1,4-dihydroxy-2-naphthoate octaprenyltransferase [Bdellovibrionales bacterium]